MSIAADVSIVIMLVIFGIVFIRSPFIIGRPQRAVAASDVLMFAGFFAGMVAIALDRWA